MAAWAFQVTVPSGKVASDLTDFPLLIDLSDAPATFWANVRSDGGDIRASVSGSSIAVDIVAIDTGTETGEIFVLVPTLASATDTVIDISGDGVSTAPAVDSEFGRQAVWADYQVFVYFAGGTINRRTGDSPTVVGTVGSIVDGWQEFLETGQLVYDTGSYSDVWTMAARAIPQDIADDNNSVTAYSSDSTALGARVNLVFRDVGSAGEFALWNNSNSWLSGGSPTNGSDYVLSCAHNSSTSRKLLVDGGSTLSLSGASAVRPPSGGQNFTIGGANQANTSERLNGSVRFAYIRFDYLSDNWVAAEAANYKSPGTFYTLNSTVAADITFDYSMPDVFAADITFDYEITERIHSELTFDYAMPDQVAGSATFDYEIFERMVAGVTFDYAISMMAEVTFDYSMPAESSVRVTQLPVLVVSAEDRPVRVTQLPVLVVSTLDQSTRVTQLPLLALTLPKPVPLPTLMIPLWPVTENWHWLTALDAWQAGNENRSALRATPRYGVQYDVHLLDEDMYRRAYSILYRYQGVTFIHPFYHAFARLTQKSLEGTNKLFFDPAATDMREGEQLAVFNVHTLVTHFYEIDTLEADGAVLTENLEFDFGELHCVCPALPCRMTDPGSISLAQGEGTLRFSIETVEPRTFQRVDSDDLLTTLSGVPVITQQFGDDAPFTLTRGVVWQDAGMAAPVASVELATGFVSGRRVWKIERESEMDYWRALVDHMKGRLKPVLVPTFKNDVPIVTPIQGDGTTVTTTNTNVSYYFEHRAVQYLRFESTSGQVFYRRVLNWSINYDSNGDPETVDIDLSAAVGPAITLKRVSLMHLMRNTSDTVPVTHDAAFSVITMDLKMVYE